MIRQTMVGTSEEALLLALETHEEVFETLKEMLSSENYLKVLMVVSEEKRFSDMAEDAGVAEGTVSNALKELEKFGLVEQTEEGYEQTLSVLGHPVIKHIFWKGMDNDA